MSFLKMPEKPREVFPAFRIRTIRKESIVLAGTPENDFAFPRISLALFRGNEPLPTPERLVQGRAMHSTESTSLPNI